MKKICLVFALAFALILPAAAQNSIEQGGKQIKAVFKYSQNTSDPYLRELERRIKRNWVAQKYDVPFRIVFEFKVLHDGKLKDLKLVQSSGDNKLDKNAKAAIELTAPFAPLPPGYKGEWVDMQMMFWQTN